MAGNRSVYRRGAIAGLLGCLATVLGVPSASGHEFWIAPKDYTPASGERVAAGLKVGQMLNGADYPYLSDRFESFTVTTPQGAYTVESDEGDIPALGYLAEEAGLHVLAYHAKAEPLTWDTMQEFADYLAYEGLSAVVAKHQARGLPESGFGETYIRYAKALVQVGPVGPQDRDQPLGLPLELVALENPYDEAVEQLPVVLKWQGAPVANAQISVFRRNAGVTRSIVTTDAEGRAEIPLALPGEYLLNAVHMEPVNSSEVVWQSHWASLTFQVDR